jgi:glutamine cyclotransferase
LEYVHGEVYANIWHTDRIAHISPRTGQVLGPQQPATRRRTN